MLFRIFLAFNILFLQCRSSFQACLHNGCYLSQGLKAHELERKVKYSLRRGEKTDNVLKVVTWNGKGFDENWRYTKNKVCDYIKKIEPTIFALQDVGKQQLTDLKGCLTKYSIVDDSNRNKDGRRNPIFYKKNRLRLRVISYGRFNISDNNDAPKDCTWVKIQYAEIRHSRRVKAITNRLMRLLNIYTGKKNSYTPQRRVVRRRYRWKTIFVANIEVDDSNEKVAKQQIKKFMLKLKNEVMDRRRFPVIVTGDLGHEDNSEMYRAIKQNKWLENTMESSRSTYPALSYVTNDSTINMKLRDYVLENKLENVLAGTLVDDPSGSNHRPVYAAMLV